MALVTAFSWGCVKIYIAKKLAPIESLVENFYCLVVVQTTDLVTPW